MGYHLGIDVGTTYTAAAVHRDGRVEIETLGDRAASIPSVVFLREDSTVLTGEAAARRAVTEPGRVVREFKRRVGDSTPVLLAGSPFSAEHLTVTKYQGPTWPGYSPNTLVVIEKSTTVITTFTAIDVTTGQPISISAGSKVTPPTGGGRSSASTSTSTTTTTTTTTPSQPVDVTGDGAGSASSSSAGFGPELGVDGNTATSWFSAGVADPAGSETSVYTWTANKDHQITGIQLVGNGANSNPAFRSGYGFNSATVEVLNSLGVSVFSQDVSFASTNDDPNTNLSLNALGKVVRITFHHHQNPDCGGFAELHVLASS